MKIRRKCMTCEKLKEAKYRRFNMFYCSKECALKDAGAINVSAKTCAFCEKKLIESRDIYTTRESIRYDEDPRFYCSEECFLNAKKFSTPDKWDVKNEVD